jgi:hypothetical protein
MRTDLDMLRGVRPPRPPAELRARVLSTARTAAATRCARAPERLAWLRPQLGWIVAALLLVGAHALLDAALPIARASHAARVAAVRPARTDAEAAELAAAGVTREMVADLPRGRRRLAAADLAALYAVQ